MWLPVPAPLTLTPGDHKGRPYNRRMDASRPIPKFSWFVPIDGDGDRIGSLRAQREPTFAYLRDVVLNAERLGYHSLLIPTRFANGSFEHSAPLAETWTTASALCAVSSSIRLLIAVRPGITPVGLFAQQAATLHEISSGRVDINIVPGGIQGDNERLGIGGSHADRYAQADEFIDACAQLWHSGGPLDFDGQAVRLNGAVVSPTPSPPAPEWYLGGASDAALKLAAERADVLLCWIQPQDAMADLVARARTPSPSPAAVRASDSAPTSSSENPNRRPGTPPPSCSPKPTPRSLLSAPRPSTPPRWSAPPPRPAGSRTTASANASGTASPESASTSAPPSSAPRNRPPTS